MLLKTMDQWTDKGQPAPDFHWEVTGPGVGRPGVGRGKGQSIGSGLALTQMERASQEGSEGQAPPCKIHIQRTAEVPVCFGAQNPGV